MLGAGNDLAPAIGWAFGGIGWEGGGGEMLVLPNPNTDTKEADALLSRPCPKRLGLTSVLPKAVCEHTPVIRLHWYGNSCSVKTSNFGELKLLEPGRLWILDARFGGALSRHELEDMEVDYEDAAELEKEEEGDPGLVAFVNSCTLHGANHIFVESGFGVRQALWAGAFLFSLSIFLYQVAGRIFYYLEYHHITQLDEQESSEMPFPAVTFCNFNRIRVSQLTYSDVLYISPLVGYEDIPLDAGFPLVPPAFEAPDEPLNLYNFFDRNSHQLEDMMLTCKYRGEPCRPDDFSVVSGPCVCPSASFSQGCSEVPKKDCGSLAEFLCFVNSKSQVRSLGLRSLK
uniref:Uncharacterized protein n=1 Tax=Sphaerodactylus townsendi TaxID=933632 RepID=A0ACB8EL75_9SAUR